MNISLDTTQRPFIPNQKSLGSNNCFDSDFTLTENNKKLGPLITTNEKDFSEDVSRNQPNVDCEIQDLNTEENTFVIEKGLKSIEEHLIIKEDLWIDYLTDQIDDVVLPENNLTEKMVDEPYLDVKILSKVEDTVSQTEELNKVKSNQENLPDQLPKVNLAENVADDLETIKTTKENNVNESPSFSLGEKLLDKNQLQGLLLNVSEEVLIGEGNKELVQIDLKEENNPKTDKEEKIIDTENTLYYYDPILVAQLLKRVEILKNNQENSGLEKNLNNQIPLPNLIQDINVSKEIGENQLLDLNVKLQSDDQLKPLKLKIDLNPEKWVNVAEAKSEDIKSSLLNNPIHLETGIDNPLNLAIDRLIKEGVQENEQELENPLSNKKVETPSVSYEVKNTPEIKEGVKLLNKETTFTTTKEELSQNINNHIHSMALKGKNSQITLTLEPPHVGTVTIKVRIQDNRVQTEIFSSHAEFLKDVESTCLNLKHQLQEKEMILDKFDVRLTESQENFKDTRGGSNKDNPRLQREDFERMVKMRSIYEDQLPEVKNFYQTDINYVNQKRINRVF